MALSNVSVPNIKAAVVKPVNFKAPMVKMTIPNIKTNISAKPIRPATIKMKK